MLDIGWGEILLLGVLALLIFGPEQLPKVAADAGRLVRRLREMARSTQQDIAAHGIDVAGIKKELRDVADLHPKRILGAAMSDAVLRSPTPERPVLPPSGAEADGTPTGRAS